MMEVSDKVADMKGLPTETDLIKQLQNEVLVVTFNKKDGDKRVMTCTKSFDVIPEADQPKSDKKPKDGLVTVWDIDAKGWRSFVYERVTLVEQVNTDGQ